MIKLILGVSRRADWSREEWLTHYTERHGPLVAGLDVFGQHTLKYVQNYALTPAASAAIPNHASRIDGISELWFEDVAAIGAAYGDPNYMAVVRPDELSFCDLNAITGGIGREHSILTETPDDGDKKWVRKSRVRLIIFRQASAGRSDSQLQKEWLEAAGTISQEASFKRYARAYVQTHIQNEASPLPSTCPYGVIDELWFQSESDALAYWTDTRDSTLIRQLESAITSPAEALACFMRSHSVFDDA